MIYQTTFERYELKYLVSLDQKAKLLESMSPYMMHDKYGQTTIRNIYFDTNDYRIIRRSIEKPVYKEKLRIRSYAKATKDSTVFAELKKKYNDIVFKRRIPLPLSIAMSWLLEREKCPYNKQISREIDYFLDFYEDLRPSIFLTYDREAYFDKDHGTFRVTFDENILCRQDDIDLSSEIYGSSILPKDHALMEIKCSGGIPLWMVNLLSHEHLYKTSFSKYGTAYQTLIFPAQNTKLTQKKEYVGHEHLVSRYF